MSKNNENDDIIVKNICVYCGSSENVEPAFKEASAELGKLIATNDRRVVYGGGRNGLMGIVADAALEHGGEVIGVIPLHLDEKEVAHQELTELHVVDSMHVRKQMMVEKSDSFVILPGGLGTMDEFFEIFTWWQLGLHDKPIVIANINEYWTPLLNLVENIASEGFCRKDDLDFMRVVNSVEDIIPSLDAAPRETSDPKTKWI